VPLVVDIPVPSKLSSLALVLSSAENLDELCGTVCAQVLAIAKSLPVGLVIGGLFAVSNVPSSTRVVDEKEVVTTSLSLLQRLMPTVTSGYGKRSIAAAENLPSKSREVFSRKTGHFPASAQWQTCVWKRCRISFTRLTNALQLVGRCFSVWCAMQLNSRLH
jgi:hypothetical protein